MPYYMTRAGDKTYSVHAGDPPVTAMTFPTELYAHEVALARLEEERVAINAAIRETRRRIRACAGGKE